MLSISLQGYYGATDFYPNIFLLHLLVLFLHSFNLIFELVLQSYYLIECSEPSIFDLFGFCKEVVDSVLGGH